VSELWIERRHFAPIGRDPASPKHGEIIGGMSGRGG
jgi:hypothetical protein